MNTRIRINVVLAMLMAVLTFVAGCKASPEQVDALKQTRASIVSGASKARAEIATARTSIAAIEKELALLPADDPARKPLEKTLSVARDALDKSEKVLAELDGRLPLVDAAIKSAESGAVDPALIAEMKKVPVIGPYIPLITIIGTLGFGIWQRLDKAKWRTTAVQTIAGVDAAFPGGKPEPLKVALDAAQDTKTKVVVAGVRKAA